MLIQSSKKMVKFRIINLLLFSLLGFLLVNTLEEIDRQYKNELIDDISPQKINLNHQIENQQSNDVRILQQSTSNSHTQTKSNFPRYVWIYKNSKNSNKIYEKFLIHSIYKNSLQSSYKFIQIDEELLTYHFTDVNITMIKQKIKEKVPVNKIQQTFKDWVKLQVLARYGGVFVDENVLLTQNLVKIQQSILHGRILNRWGDSPQVFMLHSKSEKNKSNEMFFKNFYQLNIEEAWGIQYDLGLIMASRNSNLIKSWSSKFNEVLGLQHHEQKQYNYFSQSFSSRCQQLSNQSQEQLLSSDFSESILKCLLTLTQFQLSQSYYQNPKQIDFISVARKYKIWSINHTVGNITVQNMVNQEKRTAKGSWIARFQQKQQISKKLQTKDVNKITKQFQKIVIKLNFTSVQHMKELNQAQKQQKAEQITKLNKQNNSSLKFLIPKNIFVYTSNISNERLFHQINIQNLKKYALNSNYKIIYINQDNFKEYVSEQGYHNIREQMSNLQQRMKYYDQRKGRYWFEGAKGDQLRSSFGNIKKTLIIYYALYHNGGIYFDPSLTILESFESWIDNLIIDKNDFINCGNKRQIKPQLFGFYVPNLGSKQLKEHVPRQHETEKYLVIFPSLDQSFLAAVKQSSLLKQTIDLYIDILFRDKFAFAYELLNYSETNLGKIKLNSIYAEGHKIALHAVLHKKQRELDYGWSPEKGYRRLAIDQAGLVTINHYLALQKHNKKLRNDKQKWFALMSKLTWRQFQYEVGKLQFALKFSPEMMELTQNKLKNFTSNQTEYILDNSFLAKYFISPAFQSSLLNSQTFPIKKIPLRNQIQAHKPSPNARQWTKLPKDIWLIWDQGIQGHSNPFVQMSVDNLKKSAHKSGFKVHFVDKNNIWQLLGEQIRQKINRSINKAAYGMSKPQITDTWKIALMLKYGGIYLDASIFEKTLDFQWLKYITRLPKNIIWNRYGQQPQVLMYFNDLQGCPLNWSYDPVHNTKSQWHLGIQSSYLAAVKGSKYVNDWFQTFLDWITKPYSQIQPLLQKARIRDIHQWIWDNARYLTVMQALKYVLAKKQVQIQLNNLTQWRNSADFYKIWTFSGYMVGYLKFRDFTAYQNMDYRDQYPSFNNYFRHRYDFEYTQKVVGQVKFQVKMFGGDIRGTNSMFKKFYEQNKNHTHQLQLKTNNIENQLTPKNLLSQNTQIAYSQQLLDTMLHPNSLLGKFLDFQHMFHNLTRYYYGKEQFMKQIQMKNQQEFQKQIKIKHKQLQKKQLNTRYKFLSSVLAL